MYTRIAVPLDGSVFAEGALPIAAELARRERATLELVHARPPHLRAPNAPAFDTRFDDEMEQLDRERVTSLASVLGRRARLAVEARFTTGVPADAVRSRIIEAGVDLVVMASHRRSGFGRAWFGSVADALVRQSPAPLLLVPPRTIASPAPSAAPFRRILFPLDRSPRSRKALAHAMALGTPALTEVLLLTVTGTRTAGSPTEPGGRRRRTEREHDLRAAHSRAERYLERVAESLRVAGVNVTTHIRVDTGAARAIVRFARELDVDLIALSTRVRSSAERIFLGSVADDVVRSASAAVLLCGPRVPGAPVPRLRPMVPSRAPAAVMPADSSSRAPSAPANPLTFLGASP